MSRKQRIHLRKQRIKNNGKNHCITQTQQSHRFKNHRIKSKRNYSSRIQTSISGNDKKNYRKDETNMSKYSMKLSCTWLEVIQYINTSYEPSTSISTSTHIIRRNKQWKILKINTSNEEIWRTSTNRIESFKSPSS